MSTAIEEHAASTGDGVHGATSALVGGAIIARDASGRAKVSDPSEASDAANKAYVDSAVQGKLNHPRQATGLIQNDTTMTVTNLSMRQLRAHKYDVGEKYLSPRSLVYHFDETDDKDENGNEIKDTCDQYGKNDLTLLALDNEIALNGNYDVLTNITFPPAIIVKDPYTITEGCLLGLTHLRSTWGTRTHSL